MSAADTRLVFIASTAIAILANCLDEFDPALRDTFFSAYGLATPDIRKIDFHLLLDECL